MEREVRKRLLSSSPMIVRLAAELYCCEAITLMLESSVFLPLRIIVA